MKLPIQFQYDMNDYFPNWKFVIIMQDYDIYTIFPRVHSKNKQYLFTPQDEKELGELTTFQNYEKHGIQFDITKKPDPLLPAIQRLCYYLSKASGNRGVDLAYVSNTVHQTISKMLLDDTLIQASNVCKRAQVNFTECDFNHDASVQITTGGRKRFESLTVKELQHKCAQRKLKYSGLRKAELIALLRRR